MTVSLKAGAVDTFLLGHWPFRRHPIDPPGPLDAIVARPPDRSAGDRLDVLAKTSGPDPLWVIKPLVCGLQHVGWIVVDLKEILQRWMR
jgi:hypothetical protein